MRPDKDANLLQSHFQRIKTPNDSWKKLDATFGTHNDIWSIEKSISYFG